MSLNKIHVSLVTKVIFTFVISLAFMGISASADYNGPFYNDGNTPFAYNLNGKNTATAAMTLTGNKTGMGYPTTEAATKNINTSTTNLPIDYDLWKREGNTALSANLNIVNNTDQPQNIDEEIRLNDLSEKGVYLSKDDKDSVLNQLHTIAKSGKIETIDFYFGNNPAIEVNANTSLDDLHSDQWNSSGSIGIQFHSPNGGGNGLTKGNPISFKIPLSIYSDNAKTANFTMTQYHYDSANTEYTVVLKPKFSEKIVKSGVNDKPYLATEHVINGGNSSYLKLPDDVQNLVPTAHTNPIIFDPFGVGFDKAKKQQSNLQPFEMGSYYVETKPIFDGVSHNGWSIEYEDQKNNVMYQHYSYIWVDNLPTIVDQQGKPVVMGQYATYVSLRKVLDTKDWTMKAGESVDPSEGFEDWITNNKKISNFNEAKSARLTVDTSKVNNQQAGTYPVTYTVPDAKFDGETTVQNVSKTAYVTVTGNGGGSNSTSGSSSTGSTTNTNPNTGSNSTSNSNNNSTSSSSSSTNNNGSNSTSVTTTGAHVNTKGTAVYATKKIGLYKKADFSRHNRIKWYAKTKRVNRPEFIVKGFKRDNSGKLRYRVQQYNPYTGKYVKGTKGYITASAKYVVSAYYQSVPKSKKIRVINRKGVNSYKKATLTKKVKNYKKGTLLKVKKVIHHKLATRYVLTNGRYITANKKFVIQK